MAGTLTLSGLAAGLLSGQKVIGPYTVTGTATVGTVLDATLASGDNTFAIPSGATAVAVFVSSANTAVLKVGFAASPTAQTAKTGLIFEWTFDSAAVPATLYINAASSGGAVEVTFI